MDTVFLTQLHYIITLKVESYHKALIMRFQIKSICTSNQIRTSVICHGPLFNILCMNTTSPGLLMLLCLVSLWRYGIINGEDNGCVHRHNKLVAEFEDSVPLTLDPMLDLILFTFHFTSHPLIVISMLSFMYSVFQVDTITQFFFSRT
jgi:hypothetical protein